MDDQKEKIAIPKVAPKPVEKAEVKPDIKPVEKTKSVEKSPEPEDRPFYKPYQMLSQGLTWNWDNPDLTKDTMFRTLCHLLGEDPFAIVEVGTRETEIIKKLGTMIIEKVGAREDKIAKELSRLRRLLPIMGGNELMGMYELLLIEKTKFLKGGDR